MEGALLQDEDRRNLRGGDHRNLRDAVRRGGDLKILPGVRRRNRQDEVWKRLQDEVRPDCAGRSHLGKMRSAGRFRPVLKRRRYGSGFRSWRDVILRSYWVSYPFSIGW